MKRIVQATHIALSLLALVACASSNNTLANPMPSNEFTRAYEPLTDDVASSLVDIALLSSPSLSSLLLKVGYISEDNLVIGIHSNGGTVIGWKADTATIEFTHELGIVTSKALALIASGEKLIGAMEHTYKLNELGQSIEYVNGIALWDVRTGALIKCITYPCQDNSSARDGFLGLTVDSNGQWMAIFSESGIGLSDVFGDSQSQYIEPVALDSSYHWQIGSVAFDEQNRRYVLVFQEGRICVYKEHSLDYSIITKGKREDIVTITDTQIDPTGSWLAVARGNTTQILNLDNGKVLFQIKVSNPILSFDRTGKLLFVGSSNKLAIYSLENASKIYEYDAFGITSLAISEDNRLVIWGDDQGRIHIWGKPLLNQ